MTTAMPMAVTPAAPISSNAKSSMVALMRDATGRGYTPPTHTYLMLT
jgi:hypothetical protein